MEGPDHGIRSSRAGGVLTLAIDRPATRNALDVAAFDELTRQVREAAGAGDVRVIVVRGAGDGPFSAGYDLGGLGDTRADAASARAVQAPVRRLADTIVACPKPVVAAVRRFAIGAALDIVAHCDVRVGEATSRYRLPAAQLGFVYPLEGVARLTAVLGRGHAERLLMLAEEFGGEEMARLGFLHRTWAAEDFEDGLADLVAEMERLAPISIAGFKSLLNQSILLSPALVAHGYERMADSLNSHDAREGVAAFRERRKPRFIGA